MHPEIRINLFTSSYREKDEQRRQELLSCLTRNSAILGANRVHLLKEGDTRITYQDMFDHMAKHSGPDDINILANSDIYLDETIHLAEKIGKDECYALTRYNVLGENKIQFEDTPGSQDVWIFRGRIKPGNYSFPMGMPGCDNRIAHELLEAGYRVYNPSLAIKTYHLHSSAKSYDDSTPRVEPPYHLPPIIEMPKKIFHISLGTHQKAQILALKGLGDYDYIDWTKYQKNLPEFHRLIQEKVEGYHPEAIFMQLQREGIILPEMVKRWKELGIRVINWTGDVRYPLPQWFKDVGQHCLTLFTNDHDIEVMRSHGLEADYMQIGYDEKVYHPLGAKVECPPVVFLGNNYGGAHFPLSEERRRTVKLLREQLGDNFGLYGSGWQDGWALGNFNSDELKEAEILRSAKIVINLSHFNYGRYSSDRLWRALGCGAMVISHHFKGIEKEFTPNSNLKTYDNFHKLPQMCRYYLQEEDERRQIALNGWRLAKNSMTWAHRIKGLNQWL